MIHSCHLSSLFKPSSGTWFLGSEFHIHILALLVGLVASLPSEDPWCGASLNDTQKMYQIENVTDIKCNTQRIWYTENGIHRKWGMQNTWQIENMTVKRYNIEMLNIENVTQRKCETQKICNKEVITHRNCDIYWNMHYMPIDNNILLDVMI